MIAHPYRAAYPAAQASDVPSPVPDPEIPLDTPPGPDIPEPPPSPVYDPAPVPEVPPAPIPDVEPVPAPEIVPPAGPDVPVTPPTMGPTASPAPGAPVSGGAGLPPAPDPLRDPEDNYGAGQRGGRIGPEAGDGDAAMDEEADPAFIAWRNDQVGARDLATYRQWRETSEAGEREAN